MATVNRTSDVGSLQTAEHRIGIEHKGVPILQAAEAATFFTRLRGLHGMLPLAQGDALIIRPCNAIHTFTMRCVIDVVFVDASGCILCCETVPRWRFVRCSGAKAVIEMQEGTIDRCQIVVQDVLTLNRGTWA